MAKGRDRLSRESIQKYLEESDTPDESGDSKKPDDKGKKPKKKAGQNTLSQMTQAAGRLTNTIGGALVAEVEHSEFKTRITSFLMGLGLTAAAFVLLSFMPFMKSAETFGYDIKMQLRPDEPPESELLGHIDIDDNSILTVGRWPWPRQTWAGFVKAARDAGVSQLFFDVEFSEAQQVDIDQGAYTRLKEFTKTDLMNTLKQSDETVRGSLSNIKVKLADIDKMVGSQDASIRSSASLELKRLQGDYIDVLDTKIAQLGQPTVIPRELLEKLKGITKDHDDIFAEAIGESGIVYLPVSFEHTHLVKPSRAIPWNDDAFKIVSDFLQSRYDSGTLDELRREEFGQHLTGKTFTTSEGDSFTITAEQAERIQVEEYQVLQRLFLHHLIRHWYLSKPQELIKSGSVDDKSPDALIRRHMREYRANWLVATFQSRMAAGQPLEKIAGIKESSEVGKLVLQQLHRFYSWYQLVHGAERSDGSISPSWVLPTSIVKDFDPKAYDHWSTAEEGESFYREQMPSFTDIDLTPPIYRLFSQAQGTGFVYREPDLDGKDRSVPLFALYHDTVADEYSILVQLGLSAMLQRLNVDVNSIEVELGKEVRFQADSGLVKAYRDGSYRKANRTGEMVSIALKIDQRGHMMLNWTGSPDSEAHEIFSHLPCSPFVDVSERQRSRDADTASYDRSLRKLFANLITTTYDASGKRNDKLLNALKLPLGETDDALAKELKAESSVVLDLRLQLPEFLKEVNASDDREAKTMEICDAFRRKLLQVQGYSSEQIAAGDIPDDVSSTIESILVRLKDELIEAYDPKPHFGHRRNKLNKIDEKHYGRVRELALQMADGLLEPDFDYDSRVAEVKAIVAEAYETTVEELDEGLAAEELNGLAKNFARDAILGKLAVRGVALRKLLFDKEHVAQFPKKLKEYEALSGQQKAELLKIARWEIPLLLEAEIVRKGGDQPLAEVYPLAHVLDENASLTFAQLTFKDELTLKDTEYGQIIKVCRDIRAAQANKARDYAKSTAGIDALVKVLNERAGGKTCIVGASATALGDLLTSPIRSKVPGPILHTTTANTVLYSSEPSRVPFVSILFAAIAAFLMSVLTARLSATWGIVSFVLLLGGYYVVDAIIYQSGNQEVFDTIQNFSAVGFGFLGIQGYRYAVEYRAKQKIKGQFGKFLSEEAVEELQKNPDLLKLGGDESRCTVYFSDIAGFTPISESMTPVRLIHFLNEYMNLTCEQIKDGKGYVDKFIGDAVMAIWNKPVETADHAARACKAACRNMQLLKKWNRERDARGELQVGTRIGLATGPMVVGMMGTDWRLNYTAIGDTVNLAARLEAANKQYGTQTMCSKACWDEAKDVLVGHIMDNIAVKGKKTGVPVYNVIGLIGETEPNYVKGSAVYTEAFEAYQAQKWREALEGFKESKLLLPEPYDVKLGPYDHLIERCEHLVDADAQQTMEILGLKSTDEEWDGIWRLTSK